VLCARGERLEAASTRAARDDEEAPSAPVWPRSLRARRGFIGSSGRRSSAGPARPAAKPKPADSPLEPTRRVQLIVGRGCLLQIEQESLLTFLALRSVDRHRNTARSTVCPQPAAPRVTVSLGQHERRRSAAPALSRLPRRSRPPASRTAATPGRGDAEGRTLPRAVGPGRRVQRFHAASTAPFEDMSVRRCDADIPLPKRPPEDAPGRTRTCDPLLRRREHLLRSTAACRSACATSDGPHIAAAVYCGLPLPQRFHKGRPGIGLLPLSSWGKLRAMRLASPARGCSRSNPGRLVPRA
jgi:hypothetical protein